MLQYSQMQGEPTPEESKAPDKAGRGALGRGYVGDEDPAAAEFVINAANRVRDEINDLKQDVEGANERADFAEKAADIDPQTGLWTPRKFFREINNWAERDGADPSTQIAIVFVDMNNLKAINDSMGHDAGDKAIIRVAAKLIDITDYGMRADDLRAVSRSSRQGDEFFLAFPAREPEDDEVVVGGNDIEPTILDKIDLLVSSGHENNQYATGYAIATRGEILANSLKFYMNIADQMMYKNKTEMKKRGESGTNQI